MQYDGKLLSRGNAAYQDISDRNPVTTTPRYDFGILWQVCHDREDYEKTC